MSETCYRVMMFNPIKILAKHFVEVIASKSPIRSYKYTDGPRHTHIGALLVATSPTRIGVSIGKIDIEVTDRWIRAKLIRDGGEPHGVLLIANYGEPPMHFALWLPPRLSGSIGPLICHVTDGSAEDIARAKWNAEWKARKERDAAAVASSE